MDFVSFYIVWVGGGGLIDLLWEFIQPIRFLSEVMTSSKEGGRVVMLSRVVKTPSGGVKQHVVGSQLLWSGFRGSILPHTP